MLKTHLLAEQKFETYAMTKTKSVAAKNKKIDRFILLFGWMWSQDARLLHYKLIELAPYFYNNCLAMFFQNKNK